MEGQTKDRRLTIRPSRSAVVLGMSLVIVGLIVGIALGVTPAFAEMVSGEPRVVNVDDIDTILLDLDGDGLHELEVRIDVQAVARKDTGKITLELEGLGASDISPLPDQPQP